MHVQSQASQQYCAVKILCNLFLFQIRQIDYQVLFVWNNATSITNKESESTFRIDTFCKLTELACLICINIYVTASS